MKRFYSNSTIAVILLRIEAKVVLMFCSFKTYLIAYLF